MCHQQDAVRRDAIRQLRKSLYMLNGDVIDEVLTAAMQEELGGGSSLSPVHIDGSIGQL